MSDISMMPVEVRFKPSGKWWIASAPELEVTTQGATFPEAEANLREAVALFIESCLRRGTLEQVLREAGFSTVRVKAVRRAAQSFVPPASRTTSKQCPA